MHVSLEVFEAKKHLILSKYGSINGLRNSYIALFGKYFFSVFNFMKIPYCLFCKHLCENIFAYFDR
jgi:hypothetical protein